MEVLVRYPGTAQEKNKPVDELELVKKREGLLKIALTLLLSANLVLAFGAVTLFSLLVRETMAR